MYEVCIIVTLFMGGVVSGYWACKLEYDSTMNVLMGELRKEKSHGTETVREKKS